MIKLKVLDHLKDYLILELKFKIFCNDFIKA